MAGKAFKVEKIIDERDAKEYLIKWANFDDKDNTWEPAKSISHLEEVLGEWEREKTKNGHATTSRQVATECPQTIAIGSGRNIRNTMKRKSLDPEATSYKRVIKSEPIDQLPTDCSSSSVAEETTPRSSMENQRSAEPVAADVSVSDEDEVAVILCRRLEECANLFLGDLSNHRNNVNDTANESFLEQRFERQRQELEGEWGKEKRDLQDKIKKLVKDNHALSEKLKEVKLDLVKEQRKGVTNKTVWENRMDGVKAEKEEGEKQLKIVKNFLQDLLKEAVKQETVEELIPKVEEKFFELCRTAHKYEEIVDLIVNQAASTN